MVGTPKSDLALRLLTAAGFVPLLLYLLYLAPPWGFVALAAGVCAVGAWELFRMVAPGHPLLQLWGIAASVCLFFVIGTGTSAPLTSLVVIAITCGGLLAALVAPEPIAEAAQRLGWAVGGPLYMGGLFGAVVALFAEGRGSGWVLLALLCGFLSDTAAYFVGRRWGRRKLHPVVSANKTVEGSLAGLAAGLASGLVAHAWFLPELALLPAVALSLVATAIGQAGDLCESLIKRSTGLKDSGDVLPGHGGILDRTDAMLFSAATIYAYQIACSG